VTWHLPQKNFAKSCGNWPGPFAPPVSKVRT